MVATGNGDTESRLRGPWRAASDGSLLGKSEERGEKENEPRMVRASTPRRGAQEDQRSYAREREKRGFIHGITSHLLLVNPELTQSIQDTESTRRMSWSADQSWFEITDMLPDLIQDGFEVVDSPDAFRERKKKKKRKGKSRNG